jgi:DNA-binding transcriptional MerR regulator
MNETRSPDTTQGRPADLMLIREFSARSRLTQKALRLYDALGLLEPVFTDPHSGYRYYAEDQLGRARLISLLRQLEMPLGRIAAVLDLHGVQAAREVSAYWHEVEAVMRERRGLVQYLEGLLNPLQAKGDTMFKVETRSVPEQKIATIQRAVLVDKLPAFIDEAYGKLYAHLAAAGVQPAPVAPFVIYHGEVNADSDGPVEVCVPFTGSLEPSADVRVRIEPAHDEAFTRITKAQVRYPEIMRAYDAVNAWMREHNKVCTLGSREVYFAPWDTVADHEPAADIAYPY